MSITPETTALAVFRLFIADVDPDNQVLDDTHAGLFLSLYGVDPTDIPPSGRWSIRRAAADALDAIAVSETLVGKVIRTQDLSTDGTKVAASLREQAARLRTLADEEEEAELDATDAHSDFGVVEFAPYPFPARW